MVLCGSINAFTSIKEITETACHTFLAHKVPFLDETPERCQPCSGTNHYDGSLRTSWEPEIEILQ